MPSSTEKRNGSLVEFTYCARADMELPDGALIIGREPRE